MMYATAAVENASAASCGSVHGLFLLHTRTSVKVERTAIGKGGYC